MNPSANF